MGLQGVLGFIAMSVMLVIFIVTVKFQAEKFENQLEASYQNMQNVYSSVEKILTSSGITVKNFVETVAYENFGFLRVDNLTHYIKTLNRLDLIKDS